MSDSLNAKTQRKALDIVAEWLGPKMGYDGPAPTGKDAAWSALGPMLNPEWDWPSSGPTPTILLEGGPYDWAIDVSFELREKFSAIGVFAEPYAGYALCLYPADPPLIEDETFCIENAPRSEQRQSIARLTFTQDVRDFDPSARSIGPYPGTILDFVPSQRSSAADA